MARPEWLRTFVAVYRAGSITEAAHLRALSQPAASQQLAGLERAIGTPLFARSPAGVVPTARGRALYAEVAAALDQLEAVLSVLEVVPLEQPADEAYGTIRAQLEQAGTRIGGNDLLIAAHAKALGYTVVTDNEREFSRVDGLMCKNWLRGS